MTKFLPAILLIAPMFAWAELELQSDASPEAEPLAEANWVDSSHAYATDKTQQLTLWMDDFFGDTQYELEQAQSFLRLELADDWEQEDGHNLKVRVRGKIQLPKISRRLNLVFSGEDAEQLDEDERREEDTVALQYQLKENSRSRLDVTMGISSGHLKPGLRFRNEGALGDWGTTYRFTERLQYQDGKNFFSRTQFDLNHAISKDMVLRWSNRGTYGQKTNGVEWRTKLSLRQRINPDSERPIALNYFGKISGETRPDSYVQSYKVGVLYRRQVYREFLYLELEPAYNIHWHEYDSERHNEWSMLVKLEIALHRNLLKKKKD